MSSHYYNYDNLLHYFNLSTFIKKVDKLKQLGIFCYNMETPFNYIIKTPASYIKFIKFIKPKHSEEQRMKIHLLSAIDNNNNLSYNKQTKKIYDEYIEMLYHRSTINRCYKKGGDKGHKIAQYVSLILLELLLINVDEIFKTKIMFDIEHIKELDNMNKQNNEIFTPVRNLRYSKKRSLGIECN
jgi:hypothetical protein